MRVTTYYFNLPSAACSAELLSPKQRALPGRWIDGGSTYRVGRAGTQWKGARGGPVLDTDIIIVGAGPVGLMLAGELCLAGVRPLVLAQG